MREMTAKLAFGALLTGALAGVGCGSDNGFNGVILPPTSTISPSPTVTGGPYLVPPVAANDTYTVTGNGRLVVTAAQGVLANDQPNQTTPTLVTSPSKGTLTLSNDGSFTYTPNTGVSNTTDTFSYSLSNSSGTVTATVTINIGVLGAFVDNSAAAGGDGTQARPFRTLAEAVAANGSNPVTFVLAKGNGTYNEGATLQAGQNITSLDPANAATLTGPVFLTSNNSVSKLNFNATAPAAINATGAAGGTIDGVNVTTTGNKAVFLGNATGTWTVQNSQFANANLGALDATSDSGALSWTVNNCDFSNCLVSVAGNITSNASQQLTVTNSRFVRGRDLEMVVTAAANSHTMNFIAQGNSVQGQGTTIRGLDILVQGTSTLVASVKSNVITGCTDSGIMIESQQTSVADARFNSNDLRSNLANLSFFAESGGTSNLHLALDANSADRFLVGNGGGGIPLTVENLSTVSSRNTGTFTNQGAVDGPCAAP